MPTGAGGLWVYSRGLAVALIGQLHVSESILMSFLDLRMTSRPDYHGLDYCTIECQRYSATLLSI